VTLQDPEKKLEELRRLPPSLLSRLISTMQATEPREDEDRGRTKVHFALHHPRNPNYRDASTQYESSLSATTMVDMGTQCRDEDFYDLGSSNNHGWEPNQRQSVTPKASMRFGETTELNFDGTDAMKTPRARSIDSALGGSACSTIEDN